VDLSASLSQFPSRALAAKAARITALIRDFDARFLAEEENHAAGHHNRAGAAAAAASARDPTRMPLYPAWALPFVEEMARKLDAVVRAQHRAEEAEELLASTTGAGQGAARARRDREASSAAQRLHDVEALKAAAAARQSPSRGSRQGQSPPGDNFYPDDAYLVGLNDELAFVRDKGSFTHRRAAPRTVHASPRRNLNAMAASHDSVLPYQARGRSREQMQQQQQPSPPSASEERAARAAGGPRPTSAASQRYLTGLLGHDVGASTLNRLFRSERSPSPPARRARPRSASPPPPPVHQLIPPERLPGPTIPKAIRFSPYSTPTRNGSPSKKGASERERMQLLENQALQLRVDELCRLLAKQRYDREREEWERGQQAPLSPQQRKAMLSHSTSTSGLHSDPPPEPSPSSSGLDESVLASALIRIGEANRERFLGLVQQILALQAQVAQQGQRMDHLSSSGTQSSGLSAEESARLREEQERMNAELARLQGELAASLGEKERLGQQVRELRLHAERSKFALMEKVSLLSSAAGDGAREGAQDRALLAAYEADLRASRDAIAQLQGLVGREADHARAFKHEKEQLQKRLDSLASTLAQRDRADKAAAFEAGRRSLTPAERLRSLMHKYMVLFYRKQLEEATSGASSTKLAAARIEAELMHSREEHERELVQQQRAHKAVLAQVSSTLIQREEEQEELVERLENAAKEIQVVQTEAQQTAQSLLATELLAQDLQSQLAAATGRGSSAAASSTDMAFSALMLDSFKGDYLRARNDARLLKLVYAVGDERVLFSDFVQRIDHNNKYQKRILLITERHLLCLWADRGRPLRRRIPLDSIIHVSLSRQSAATFVVHAADAYDYLLVSDKRAEILYHLLSQVHVLSGGAKTLKFKYGERLYVRDRAGLHRDVQVGESALILGAAGYRHANTREEDDEEAEHKRLHASLQ
jgi:ribose 5-phosphate isomerase RpiB